MVVLLLDAPPPSLLSIFLIAVSISATAALTCAASSGVGGAVDHVPCGAELSCRTVVERAWPFTLLRECATLSSKANNSAFARSCLSLPGSDRPPL